MGIFDNEKFLPGVITEIEADYSYGYDTSLFGTTDSEVIIGTAFDGPSGILTPVYSPEHGEYVFGKIYDTTSRLEATLVAGIKDAWDRGCRTIYAFRVGGKDLYKDFDLCIDAGLKLRVSALYPSNLGKQVYMLVDNTAGAETIKFYKPASRATIAEKNQGLVINDSTVLTTELRINQDYGIGKDGKLVELVRLINEHQYNNVLKLSIVNKDGVDVTNSSEAYELAIGAIYPGVYFIGREDSTCTCYTDVKFNLTVDANSTKPYNSFDGSYFRTLVINTDVKANLPIYAKSMTDLREILKEVNVTMNKDWDFLETVGLPDRAFTPDEEDYEEVNMNSFEIYKRLGSGYAITAMAERRTSGTGEELTPRVKEAPMDDSNRIAPIKDGVYSTLEDANIKYRVLTCASADTKISGKLPRPTDFKISIPEEIEILDGLIKVSPNIDQQEQKASKSYTFKFEKLEEIADDNIADIYIDAVIPVISKISDITELHKTMETGVKVMLVNKENEGTLIRIDTDGYETLAGEGLVDELYVLNNTIYRGEKKEEAVVFKVFDKSSTGTHATMFEKQYILVENNDEIFVMEINEDATVTPLGDLKTMLSDNKERTLVYGESNYFGDNPIIVKSAIYDVMTVEEFTDYLNEHEYLGKLFNFSLTAEGALKKDEYIAEIAADAIDIAEYKMPIDHSIGYDYSLYIPYRTTDNFARQLAQHCTYTELKTCPAYGIIGCEKLVDTGLTSIAKKVESILALEFDLYAKNDYGRNLLDRNNLPYNIGKNISVCFFQNYVTTDDGYRYISNGAPGYGGMVSTLPLDQSSTNQPISLTPMFTLTNYQLDRLTQKGIVTVRNSFTRGYVITDGITMAPSTHIFRRLAASRIVGAVEDLIRQAAEPYIGQQNHAANRNSLQTAIKSNLTKIVGTLIEEYEFNLVVDPSIAKFNYIDIDYTIVPIYEIREIRNRISVRDQL